MNILLIGGNGFLGKSLSEHISRKSRNKIFIMDRNYNDQISDSSQFIGSLEDSKFVSNIFQKIEPDIIYFFITKFFISSEKDLENTKNISTLNIKNIFNYINKKSKIVYVSSSAVYGDVPLKYQPVDEATELNPISRYGKLKAYEESVFTKLSLKFKVNLIIARIFNITGPNEPKRMIGGSIISQLLESGNLQLGNLFPKRDFIDIRDVACSLYLLGLKGKNSSCYNICSGKLIAIKSILDMIVEELSLDYAPKIIRKKERVNPFEITELLGSNKKIIKLGWRQNYIIKSSIKDLVKSYKRKKIGRVLGR